MRAADGSASVEITLQPHILHVVEGSETVNVLQAVIGRASVVGKADTTINSSNDDDNNNSNNNSSSSSNINNNNNNNAAGAAGAAATTTSVSPCNRRPR
jgi:hypothetical protein